MRYYEVTFIVDPLLPNDEAKQVADSYVQYLKGEGCELVHFTDWGVKQLAYTINKRNTGFYFTVEVKAPDGVFVTKLEIAFRRDERVMRFLTMSLDKFAVKYNEDKRAGLIGKHKQVKAEANALRAEEKAKAEAKPDSRGRNANKPAPKVEAPAVVEEVAPVVTAPVIEAAPIVEAPVAIVEAEAVVEAEIVANEVVESLDPELDKLEAGDDSTVQTEEA